MTRLDPTSVQQRERVIGAVVVLIGVAVLVLSLFALVKAGDGPGSDVSGAGVTLPATSAGATPGATASGGTGSTPPSASAAAPGSSAPTGSAAVSSPPATSTTPPAGSMPLVVLNNTRTSGLASTAADTFTAGGWTVTDTGNIDEDILSTCAYYDPDVPGAQAAAEALMTQFPAIQRTKVKFGALPDGPVVVVLTDDYTAQ